MKVRWVEGTVPLLIGVNFLKENKAQINFEKNLLYFADDGDHPVRLESGSGGHLLVPLNVFFQAKPDKEVE